MARIRSLSCTVVLTLSLTGCASYMTRKACEKTNWYQHGYNVAMSGKRLDADTFVKECTKVEAKFSYTELDTGFKAGMSKYCTGDNVFAVGKAGKPFSYDMCDGESVKKMRAQYNQGLRIFCTPSNAYRFGTSGGIYENVCNDTEEIGWIPEYRKGRKIYLKAVIDEKEKESQRLSQEVAALERQKMSLTVQQNTAAVLASRNTKRERTWDPATRTFKESVTREQDEASKRRQEALDRDINQVNYKINQTQQKQSTLNDELSKLRTEMGTL